MSTPAEAIAWDRGSAGRDITIPVYESNGTTVIGTPAVGDRRWDIDVDAGALKTAGVIQPTVGELVGTTDGAKTWTALAKEPSVDGAATFASRSYGYVWAASPAPASGSWAGHRPRRRQRRPAVAIG